MKLSEISSDLVEDYILDRAEAGAKPATIYQEYSLARRMFNVARKKWKWIHHNPFADITFSELQEIDNERERVLDIEEEKILLENATLRYLEDVIVFALHTGFRRGEILAINWRENVDLRARTVSFKATKKGKKKVVPMSDRLYEMMVRRSKIKHISGKVFPVTVAALKDAFERAVEKADLQDFHFHDMRHTFATRLVRAGVDLYTVQKLLGHKSIRMTERYAHHYPESLRPSVKALDNCYNFATIEGEGRVCPVDIRANLQVESIG